MSQLSETWVALTLNSSYPRSAAALHAQVILAALRLVKPDTSFTQLQRDNLVADFEHIVRELTQLPTAATRDGADPR